MSKFAQERVNHLKSSNDSPPVDKLTEKPISTQNIVIGNIVERTENVKSTKSLRNDTIADDKVGFPKPHRIDKKVNVCFLVMLNFIKFMVFCRLKSIQRLAKAFLL